MRSEPQCWMYTPRTISSSVRRAQSSASRLVRKVFVGRPIRFADHGKEGDCCHQIRTPKADWRTSTVPILYLLAMEPFMRPPP